MWLIDKQEICKQERLSSRGLRYHIDGFQLFILLGFTRFKKAKKKELTKGERFDIITKRQTKGKTKEKREEGCRNAEVAGKA